MTKHGRMVVLGWMAAVACIRWSSVEPSRPTDKPLRLVRVNLRTGARQVLRDAAIRGDSIAGFDDSHSNRGRLAFALADVESVQSGEGRLAHALTSPRVNSVAPWLIGGIIVAVAAGALLFIALISRT